MRQRKILITLLLVVILAIDAILLGWSIVNDGTKETGTQAIHIGFCLYVLGLAFRSVDRNTSSFHWESVLHLTTLTSIASILMSAIAILPDAPPTTTSRETIPFLWYLWRARLALYICLCVILLTTRQGPPLKYPLDRVYAEKTRLAGTNTAEENVSGSVGTANTCSVQSFIFSFLCR